MALEHLSYVTTILIMNMTETSVSIAVAGQDVEDDEEGRETGIPSGPIEYQEPLFEGVDFVILPRSRLAVLGRNGCGKTSFLNLYVRMIDISIPCPHRTQINTFISQHSMTILRESPYVRPAPTPC